MTLDCMNNIQTLLTGLGVSAIHLSLRYSDHSPREVRGETHAAAPLRGLPSKCNGSESRRRDLLRYIKRRAQASTLYLTRGDLVQS